MEVNVSKLKTELENFERKVSEYEICIVNLYNSLRDTSNSWHDANSVKYLDNVEQEYKNAKKKISELKEIKDVYKYICNRYSSIGNKIYFDLNQRNNIINAYNRYINKLDDIVKSYNYLNLNFCPYERNKVLNEKDKIINLRNKLSSLKQETINKLNEIEEIEREIKRKISSINVETIKENLVSDYM